MEDAMYIKEKRDDAVGSADHRESAIIFMERLAESTGDKMPNNTETHILFFKRAEVYAILYGRLLNYIKEIHLVKGIFTKYGSNTFHLSK